MARAVPSTGVDTTPSGGPDSVGLPLEPNPEQQQALARAVLEFVRRRTADPSPIPVALGPGDTDDLLGLLQAPPQHGRDLAAVMESIEPMLDSGFDTASGRFLSYIPSGALTTAAWGSLLGAVTNRYTSGSHAAPGSVAMEQSVIGWIASLFDLPPTAGGLLLSGGSMANLTAVVTARSRLADGSPDSVLDGTTEARTDATHDGRFDHGVIYTSERSHHSVAKAAHIAGIHPDRVRHVPADGQLRLDTDRLAEMLTADRASGLAPMMIVATAGTTDTGTVDPLARCAELAHEHGAWYHIDAAYGGFFALTERGRARFGGIERADSITVDAHKSLFLPFGIGGLVVRDTASLVAAHEGRGAYMQDVTERRLPGDGQVLPLYFSMGPELTRPNRGLPLWLALNLHGVNRFRDELDHMLDLADRTAHRLRDIDGIELAVEPELSIVAFRSSAPDPSVGDAVTERIFRYLNNSGEVHVSSTTIHDRFVIRFAFLSQRTTEAIAVRAVELVAEAVATVSRPE